jgi:hypothetical protein
MGQQIVLEHQEKSREFGEFVFYRGEIFIGLECVEGGSYRITARPATEEEEARFWALLREDMQALSSIPGR